jgi:hypothetical protein
MVYNFGRLDRLLVSLNNFTIVPRLQPFEAPLLAFPRSHRSLLLVLSVAKINIQKTPVFGDFMENIEYTLESLVVDLTPQL